MCLHHFASLYNDSLLPIANLSTDEYGRPFIILKEQQAKARVKGLEAVRVSTLSRVCAFFTVP